MCLNRVVIEDNLRNVASADRCSQVAFDYYITGSLDSQALFWRIARAGNRAYGEPLKFGIDSTLSSRNSWLNSSDNL